MYLQADELYPVELRNLAARPRAAALEFAGCINFWNSFDTVVANEFPMRYVRAFPADAPVTLNRGRLQLRPRAIPRRRSAEILHYGWCFPAEHPPQAHESRALYRDNPVYRARGALQLDAPSGVNRSAAARRARTRAIGLRGSAAIIRPRSRIC